MVLIEKTGQVHINELARVKLKALWLGAYESNMKKLIPILQNNSPKARYQSTEKIIVTA